MRQPPRPFPLWLVAIGLLLLFLWTLTENTAVSLRVADGRCMATVYGRSSAIDCPGLDGGRLAVANDVAIPGLPNPAPSLTERLTPPTAWDDVVLSAPADAAKLPASFTATATLRRPRRPAALLLLRPDGRAGWAFVIDTPNRRGAWWEWVDGPTTPLRGIPIDRPLAESAKPLARQLLNSLFLAVALAALVGRRRTTDDGRRTTTAIRPPSVVCRLLSVVVPPLFAFALSLHVSVTVLERVPHVQDSVTYLFQAQTLARGRLYAPAPPLASVDASAHFDQEFLLVRDGRWFGKYPPGWPALLALGVLAGAPWLVNPLLAVLTIALVQLGMRNYESGIEESDRRGDSRRTAIDHSLDSKASHTPPATTNDRLAVVRGLLSVVLLATSPFFVIMSGALMAHPAELFWTTLFMLAWARALRPADGHSRRALVGWALLAGLAFGALALTRQFTALTIGLSFGVGWLVVARRSGHQATGVLRSTLLAALAAAPLLLALPAYQAAVTGDTRADPRLLYWPYDRVGFGSGVGEPQNAFTMTATDAGPALTWYTDPNQPPRGHTAARGLFNLGQNLDALERDLFGWPPALTLVLVWLAFLLRRPAAVDWLLLLVVVAIAGGYVAYWAAGIAYGPRYFYAALPALVILTARGAAALSAAGGRWLAAAVLVLLLGYNLVHLPATLAGYRGYNFVSAAPRAGVEAAVAAVGRPALVFVAASEMDWWEYGAFFSGNTPWLDGPIVYARDLGPAENAWLRARFPDRAAYRWTGAQLLPLSP